MSAARVTICTASVGHGHTRAAHAIADALRLANPAGRVDVVDALATAPGWFVRGYRDAYLGIVSRVPALAGWLYDRSDRGGPGAATPLEMAGMAGLMDSSCVRDADVVVCTHFLCGRVLSRMRARGTLRAPLVVCVTDQHPHAVWLSPHADRIVVPSESARRVAEARGIDASRVRVAGIPIDVRFLGSPSRKETGRELGVPDGRRVALVCGGGLGLGGMGRAVRALVTSGRELHVIAVCGHNRRLLRELAGLSRAPGPGQASCEVLGFAEHMPALMTVADVMLGKPGGLTTAEAAAAGLAMVLFRPIPGQEERNARRLVEAGAAVLELDPEKAGRLAAELLMDARRLERMRESARALGAPGAAGFVATEVLGLAGQRAASPGGPCEVVVRPAFAL